MVSKSSPWYFAYNPLGYLNDLTNLFSSVDWSGLNFFSFSLPPPYFSLFVIFIDWIDIDSHFLILLIRLQRERALLAAGSQPPPEQQHQLAQAQHDHPSTVFRLLDKRVPVTVPVPTPVTVAPEVPWLITSIEANRYAPVVRPIRLPFHVTNLYHVHFRWLSSKSLHRQSNHLFFFSFFSPNFHQNFFSLWSYTVGWSGSRG